MHDSSTTTRDALAKTTRAIDDLEKVISEIGADHQHLSARLAHIERGGRHDA